MQRTEKVAHAVLVGVAMAPLLAAMIVAVLGAWLARRLREPVNNP
jgi:putative Ca2+/H+ antiporter (TMEM165/GDT1 family)